MANIDPFDIYSVGCSLCIRYCSMFWEYNMNKQAKAPTLEELIF